MFGDGGVVDRTDTSVLIRAGVAGVCGRAKETEQVGELFERLLARKSGVGYGTSKGEDGCRSRVVGKTLRERARRVQEEDDHVERRKRGD